MGERGGEIEKGGREREKRRGKTKAVYLTTSPFLLLKNPINQINTCLFCFRDMVQEEWNPVFF